MTDRELIRKVHKGNKEALNDIVEKYYDDIYRFCVYLTGHETDSYDITQEVFLRFIQYINSYKSRNLKGYLFMIARNLCRDYFRKNEKQILTDEVPTPAYEEKGLINAELSASFRNILLKVPPEQREVIILRIYEELSFREIAKALESNLSTVKSRFHAGIEKLQKEVWKADEI